MFIFVALIVTLVTVIYFWQKSAYSFWTDRGIPQIEPKFPFGTVQRDRYFAYTFMDAYKKYKGKSKYVGLYNLLSPLLQVLDEDVIKQILIKDFASVSSHGTYYNERDDPLSAHLFSLDGPKWREIRTKLTPTFTSGKIKMMCPIVVDIGQRFKEVMDRKIESGETGIEMRDMFAKFTTDVIGTCAFGLECNSLNDPEAIFRKMGMKIFTEPRFPTAVVLAIFSFPNLAKKLRIKISNPEVEKFFLKAVNDTVEHRIKTKTVRNDFIDLLIALKNDEKSNSMEDSHKDGLSMNEIAAQCFVFFLAGFETSSTASSFTIFELAKNQPVQDKLRNHIREVLKKHNGEMTYEALKEMTYLQQCIDEGLRLLPPVVQLRRKVTQDYKLPGTDTIIPNGTMLTIPIYALQHDEKHYPNPEVYNPDNFAPEAVTKRHPMAYLPFGDGPRNCIGERFGLMQAKIGLAYLIGNYRFKLNPKTNPKITFSSKAVVLTAEGGLHFDIEKV